MFGLGNFGNNLIDKINANDDFTEFEKVFLIAAISASETSTDLKMQAFRNDACKFCSNNPKNGGSGNCNCTLATPKIT